MPGRAQGIGPLLYDRSFRQEISGAHFPADASNTHWRQKLFYIFSDMVTEPNWLYFFRPLKKIGLWPKKTRSEAWETRSSEVSCEYCCDQRKREKFASLLFLFYAVVMYGEPSP